MKARKFWCLLLVCCLGLMTACGASSASADQAEGFYEEIAPMENQSLAEDGSSVPLPENRKWIIRVNMQAETEDLDSLTKSVLRKAADLGGYVESQDLYNGSRYDSYRYRRASLVLRIPAQSLEDFTREVEDTSNVVSTSRTTEDVTVRYVDTESRMDALEAEEKRLLELMDQALNMTDLLEIEGRLTDVRYELESVGSQLRSMDNLVDYATVRLEIEEVREYTPTEEVTVWQRISRGFMQSLKDIGHGISEFFIWILVSLPYLLIWAAVIIPAVLLIRRWCRKRRQKKQSGS